MKIRRIGRAVCVGLLPFLILAIGSYFFIAPVASVTVAAQQKAEEIKKHRIHLGTLMATMYIGKLELADEFVAYAHEHAAKNQPTIINLMLNGKDPLQDRVALAVLQAEAQWYVKQAMTDIQPADGWRALIPFVYRANFYIGLTGGDPKNYPGLITALHRSDGENTQSPVFLVDFSLYQIITPKGVIVPPRKDARTADEVTQYTRKRFLELTTTTIQAHTSDR